MRGYKKGPYFVAPKLTGKVEPFKWTWSVMLPYMLDEWRSVNIKRGRREELEATFITMAHMADAWRDHLENAAQHLAQEEDPTSEGIPSSKEWLRMYGPDGPEEP